MSIIPLCASYHILHRKELLEYYYSPLSLSWQLRVFLGFQKRKRNILHLSLKWAKYTDKRKVFSVFSQKIVWCVSETLTHLKRKTRYFFANQGDGSWCYIPNNQLFEYGRLYSRMKHPSLIGRVVPSRNEHVHGGGTKKETLSHPNSVVVNEFINDD